MVLSVSQVVLSFCGVDQPQTTKPYGKGKQISGQFLASAHPNMEGMHTWWMASSKG